MRKRSSGSAAAATCRASLCAIPVQKSEPLTLQIQDDVPNRFGTTHQQITFAWWVQRLWSVADAPVQQPALARMTHASTARPSCGHGARLGERQQIAESRTPPCRQSAARKAYRGTGADWPGGLVGFARRLVGDAWSNGLFWTEDFRVYVLNRNLSRLQCTCVVAEEGCRSTYIEVGSHRHLERIQQFGGQSP
jgi:hypothetical protein